MKHIRTMALAAMTAMALFAFGVGSASATTLEDANGNHPTEIDASLVGSAVLSAGSLVDTCTEGTVKVTNLTTGSASETVRGTVTPADLTWGNCVNEPTITVEGGELEIHHKAGTSSGTITGTTFSVTVLVGGSVTCSYGVTNNDSMVHLGTLTGSDTTPIIEIDTTVPKRAGGFLCPSTATWQATYHVTSPNGLTVTAG
jgi:hypothetical protein